MINCIVGDVECTPNFFSISFVNLNDYLIKCNCTNDKGNPIPLSSKYTVKEIKTLLESVESKQFYITDYDDKDLLPLAAYLNDMRPRYKIITTDDGLTQSIPIRTDLYGYNILGYDNLMIAAFLMYFNRFDNTKELTRHLYDISKTIISLQNEDKDAYYKHPTIELLRNYKLPYMSVDIMKVFALNKAGVLIDKDTGERKAYPKSLKQTSINLQWHELLEFELPDINDEERNYYKGDNYKNLTNEQLTKLIASFDRYIIKDYIKPMMYYNLNDDYIVCEAVRQKIDEVKLRYSISKSYNINVLSSARSNIADKLVTKFYSEMSGLHPNSFIKSKTERTKLSFKKIIFDNISFKTETMQNLLKDMKDVVIYRTNKESFVREVKLFGQTYTIATGGLHSQDIPRILKSTDTYKYIHWDIASFYPSLMINYGICPNHLVKAVFIKLLKFLRNTRVKAKHAIEEVIPGIPNKVVAEVLKIVINAIYGKLGFEQYFLYDRLAQMQVTINGQLMIMMLIENLGLAGIETVSANTDGIVVKLYNDKVDEFNKIAKDWMNYTKFEADSEEYECYINRDINNYLVKETNGKVTYKGAMDPLMYIKDLQKGYDMPIVAKAVSNYLLDNIPVMETLTNATNILDFCKTQNVGRKFSLEYTIGVNNQIVRKHIQRNTRFYVGKKGGTLEKVDIAGNRSRLAAGQKCVILNSLDDKPINERDIDYKYYYEEAFKIINPIMLSISPKGKGKTKIKKYSGLYNPLFDFDEVEI